MRLAAALLALALGASAAKALQRPREGKLRENPTPLDLYVADGDPTYSWEELPDNKMTGDGWSGHLLNFTSQSWLTADDTSQPEWIHQLLVIVPDNLSRDTWAVEYITGGHETDGPPQNSDEDVLVASRMAIGAQCVVTILFQVPNECITFTAEDPPKCRSEDAFIAWTWEHFFQNETETEWIAQLPMAKAGVRGIDAAQDFLATELNMPDVDNWFVAGASKRGWDTWLVGAVEPSFTGRVKGIIPMVDDVLSLHDNLHLHYQSLGGWSFAFEDYYALNLTKKLDGQPFADLSAIVDPISYLDRYTDLPKLLIDATGDEFMLLTDQRLWWHDMTGDKYHIISPNTEHSLATGITELLPSIAEWINRQIDGKPIPEYTEEIDETSGDITVTFADDSELPSRAKVWYAHTCNASDTVRRDFRMINADTVCECGVEASGSCAVARAVSWKPMDLEPTQGGKVYVAHMDPPAEGTNTWVGFFIDFHFRNGPDRRAGNLGWPIDQPGTLELSTLVSVMPNTFAVPDCAGEACYGLLV